MVSICAALVPKGFFFSFFLSFFLFAYYAPGRTSRPNMPTYLTGSIGIYGAMRGIVYVRKLYAAKQFFPVLSSRKRKSE